jgi:hypothetical protein
VDGMFKKEIMIKHMEYHKHVQGNKMASAGQDWKNNYKTQINWGLNYIQGRYGNPTKAWEHFKEKNWY